MSTIQEQAGITLPEWQFGKLAGQTSDQEAIIDAPENDK
jgi:flotillin